MSIPFNNSSTPTSMITLPPRSEVVIQIQITNEVTEGIVSPRKLNESILLPCALVSVDQNKQAICTAINTSENEIILGKPKISLEILESQNSNNHFVNFVSTRAENQHIIANNHFLKT